MIELAEVGRRRTDHGLAARLQGGHKVVGISGFGDHLIGHPLIVNARRRNRARDIHAAVDHAGHDLQHRIYNKASARRTGDEERFAVLEHNGRRHRRQRLLACTGCVGPVAEQAVGVRRVGPGGEVVKLIVKQHAGTGRDQTDAVAEIDGVGIGDGVAEAVDHREVRGVAAFVADVRTGTDRARRCRVRRVDRAAPLRGVILRGQLRHRHVHAIGIAKEPGAVGIRALHGLDHQEDLLRVRLAGEIVAFEDVEHFDQGNAAGGRRRHRNEIVAAVGAAHRRAFDGAIVFQILRGHHAARRLHGGRELLRDGAFVERAGA